MNAVLKKELKSKYELQLSKCLWCGGKQSTSLNIETNSITVECSCGLKIKHKTNKNIEDSIKNFIKRWNDLNRAIEFSQGNLDFSYFGY